MTRRIVQLLSHSIEAHDMLKMYHDIGHEAFDIGGYIDPAHPHDPKRPGLPEVQFYPELKQAVDDIGSPDNLGAAQEHIPDKILEWADTIVMHHYLQRMVGDWPRLRDWMRGDPNRRIIWRSVGQSVEGNELEMAPLIADGLERVAYSPKEANIPRYAGHSAIIRFGKDPDEWNGWTGDGWQVGPRYTPLGQAYVSSQPLVINITQHLRQRDPYTNWRFWEEATKGLPRLALGPGSEVIDGPGELTYDEMKEALRKARVYLYTGTQPASYTLGLIEAMMTGIPVVSIGPSWMNVFPYGPDLFEGHELAGFFAEEPESAKDALQQLLDDPAMAAHWSELQRGAAIELFGIDTIRSQWADFLR